MSKLSRIRDCLHISPEEIVRYRAISGGSYRQIEQGLLLPTIDQANEILIGLNTLLSTKKKRQLWKAGLLPARQHRFMLLDLDLKLRKT